MNALTLNHATLTVKHILTALRQNWNLFWMSNDEIIDRQQQDYLNAAVDLYDLEHRMRNVNKLFSHNPRWMAGQ